MILLMLSQLIALISLGECVDSFQSINSIPFSGSTFQPGLSEAVGFSNRSNSQYSSSPVVSTSCGKFEGASYTDGKKVQFDQFLGIRYAEPPVGELRFKNPVAFGGYKGDKTYQASAFCPPCMQPKEDALETSGMLPSEDCLCLNIYRPGGCDKGSKKPVLVFIPGTRFYRSSAATPEVRGGYLSYYGDMIVVTMNHRLGAFGWLYSGNNEIPGNAGYFDTRLAVEWVKQNIGDFGGDPEAITIGGHGSGATIANKYLIDTKIPKDLFRAVMILSPDYNLKHYVDPYWIALRKSKDLTRLVGCDDKSSGNSNELSKEAINCLKNVDAQLLGDLSNKIPGDDGNGLCSWNQLFPLYSPDEYSWDYQLTNGIFAKGKPIYTGAVPTESWKSFQGIVGETLSLAEEVIQRNVPAVIKDKSPNNIKFIMDWYLGMRKSSDPFEFATWTRQTLDDVCNGCVLESIVQKLKKFNPAYVYYYLYVASCDRDSKPRKYGPIHGDDTPISFGVPLRNVEKYSDSDRAVSLEIIGIWSDFIHGRKMKWPARDAESNPLAYLYGDAKANYYDEDPFVGVCKRMDA